MTYTFFDTKIEGIYKSSSEEEILTELFKEKNSLALFYFYKASFTSYVWDTMTFLIADSFYRKKPTAANFLYLYSTFLQKDQNFSLNVGTDVYKSIKNEYDLIISSTHMRRDRSNATYGVELADPTGFSTRNRAKAISQQARQNAPIKVATSSLSTITDDVKNKAKILITGKNSGHPTIKTLELFTKIKNNEYYFSGSTMPCPELSIEIENEAKDIFKGMIVSKIIGNKDFGFPMSKYFLEFANSKRAQITKDTTI